MANAHGEAVPNCPYAHGSSSSFIGMCGGVTLRTECWFTSASGCVVQVLCSGFAGFQWVSYMFLCGLQQSHDLSESLLAPQQLKPQLLGGGTQPWTTASLKPSPRFRHLFRNPKDNGANLFWSFEFLWSPRSVLTIPFFGVLNITLLGGSEGLYPWKKSCL